MLSVILKNRDYLIFQLLIIKKKSLQRYILFRFFAWFLLINLLSYRCEADTYLIDLVPFLPFKTVIGARMFGWAWVSFF